MSGVASCLSPVTTFRCHLLPSQCHPVPIPATRSVLPNCLLSPSSSLQCYPLPPLCHRLPVSPAARPMPPPTCIVPHVATSRQPCAILCHPLPDSCHRSLPPRCHPVPVRCHLLRGASQSLLSCSSPGVPQALSRCPAGQPPCAPAHGTATTPSRAGLALPGMSPGCGGPRAPHNRQQQPRTGPPGCPLPPRTACY